MIFHVTLKALGLSQNHTFDLSKILCYLLNASDRVYYCFLFILVVCSGHADAGGDYLEEAQGVAHTTPSLKDLYCVVFAPEMLFPVPI